MIALLLAAEATRLDDLSGLEILFILAFGTVIAFCIWVNDGANQNRQSSSNTFHRFEPPRPSNPGHPVRRCAPQCDVTIDVVKAVVIKAPQDDTELTHLNNPQTYRRLQ